MTTTATIVSERPQADGTINVRYQFTHVESGYTELSPLYRLPAGTDVQAFGDARAAEQEAKWKAREVSVAQSRYYQGEDMDDVHASGAFNFLTQDEVRKVCLRDAANRIIAVPITGVEELSACSVWTTILSPPVMVTALTNSAHTWTTQDANSFANALSTLKVAVDGLAAAGQGEQVVAEGVLP